MQPQITPPKPTAAPDAPPVNTQKRQIVSKADPLAIPMLSEHDHFACTLPTSSRTSPMSFRCMNSRRPAITCNAVCGS